MSIGAVRVFDVSIASGVSTSAAIDLGRGYGMVYYDCTGAGGSSQFYAAPTLAGTYRALRYQAVSGVSGPQTATIASSMSGSLVEVTVLKGLQFVKVEATGTIANGATLKLYCADV